MARIRSVHPGLWTDGAFIKLSSNARLLVIGLWTEADDGGAFAWDPDTLHARLFPRDDIDMEVLLAELTARNFVGRCEVEGKALGVIRNFCRFQHPERPRYVWDLPAEWQRYAGRKVAIPQMVVSMPSPTPHRHIDDTSPTPHRHVGAGEGEGEGKGRGEEKEEKKKKEALTESPVVREGGTGGTTAPQQAASPDPRKRATRLPADWKPSPEDREFALNAGQDPDVVAATFRDFWHSKAGQNATKLDWAATWRNWIRRDSRSRAAPKRESNVAWMVREFPDMFTQGDEPETSSSFTSSTTIDGEVVH